MQVKFAYIMCNLKPRSCSLKTHSTATFLKAKQREQGHDFYTERFPATIKFIRDHFQTRKFSLHGSEFQDVLVCLLFIAGSFCRLPTNKH